MTKLYTKNTWVDEVLSGNERYDIKDNGGTPINSNVSIDLITSVATAGSDVDATRMNNIENGIDAIDTAVNNGNVVNIHAAASKATPVDADEVELVDSAASFAMKRLTWANIKATLKAYLDTFYTPADGWLASGYTWSYSSADAPTFVISVNADVTGIIGAGMRIKLTQTTVKYFIVTAVGAFSAGATPITVYGGTDYTLTNAAITSPHWSNVKAPLGFSLNPSKWTVEVTDVTQRSQASPTQNTWYNLGSVSISIPIGIWNVSYAVAGQTVITAATTLVDTTLSDANSTESDVDFTRTVRWTNSGSLTGLGTITSVFASKVLAIASKTSYYLNTRISLASATTLYNRNDVSKLIIRAVCAYL